MFDVIKRLGVRRGPRWVGAIAMTVVALAALVAAASPAAGVPTDMSISTTAIDFGMVNVGATGGPVLVTLTNSGSDPFGPINMFGGAPPSAAFDASQDCQGKTLAPGASCQVSYTFAPIAPGPASDTSSFTISETSNQQDGEDFSVALTGSGLGSGTTTTTTTVASTTTTVASSTTRPRPAANPTASTSTPGTGLVGPQATVARQEVAPGQAQSATAGGFQPSELVSAVQQPNGLDLGARVADADGVVRFSWTISESEPLGSYEFVATGQKSGSVSASFTVVAAVELAGASSGTSPLLIALIAAIVLLVLAGGVVVAYHRRRQAGDHTDTAP